MRIFVTGLMMFIGGLGVGLGIGLITGKQSMPGSITEDAAAPMVQETIVTKPAQSAPEAVVDSEADVVRSPETDMEDSSQDLDLRLAEIETRLNLLELSDAAPEEPAVPANRREIDQQNLQQAGFDESEVSVITDFFNQQQLQRLEIRDRATREGWIDSAEFRQQLRENRNQAALKFSLGEDRYDLFLLSQGRNNRVRIDEVMSGSAAQQAGVVAGDVISRYADVTIYSVRDLRTATAEGERDEIVSLAIIRDRDVLELAVPRGPLGVTVSGIQMNKGN